MSTVIRAATIEDVPPVHRLERQWARDGETLGFVATSVELLVQFLGSCFFVAARHEEVVGFVYARIKRNDGDVSAVIEDCQRYLEIEDLYVTPPHRSTDIGAQLIDAVADWAEKESIRYVTAYSATRDIDRVLRFYRSCGLESWSVQMFRDLQGGSR